jgi:hypothetical protein
MEAYADYEYYTEDFGGSEIPEADFKKFSIRASYYLRQLTDNEITDEMAESSSDIKNATCAIAELISLNAEIDDAGISNERVGNYSVTYTSPAGTRQTDIRMYEVAKTYLLHTGLLYRGVYPQ